MAIPLSNPISDHQNVITHFRQQRQQLQQGDDSDHVETPLKNDEPSAAAAVEEDVEQEDHLVGDEDKQLSLDEEESLQVDEADEEKPILASKWPETSVLEGIDCQDFLQGDDVALRIRGDDIPLRIHGWAGSDRLVGSSEADELLGGRGDDVIRGEAGNDVLDGGPGRDVLFGGAGDDVLYGGSGIDVLVGGPGNDLLRGGSGRDLYVYSRGDGDDVIEEISDQNVIYFPDLSSSDVRLSVEKDSYYINVTGGGSVHIKAPMLLSPFDAALFPRHRTNVLVIRVDGISYVDYLPSPNLISPLTPSCSFP